MLFRSIILIAVGFVLLNLVGLDRSPVVWMDEVTVNDPAKELALNGRMISSVFADWNGFGEAYYWQPPGQPALMALVYKLFAFGIWQTRIPGLLFGSGTLLVLYLLAVRLLRSRSAALLSAVILGLDPKYIESARSGRMDTQSLFLALMGVLFFVGVMQDDDHASARGWRVLLAGACLGLAGITHPLAVAWVAAIGVITVAWRRPGQLHTFLVVAVLAAIPAAMWILSAAAAGDLELLRTQFLEHGSSRLYAGGVFKRIVDEVLRYAEEYKFAPLLLALYCGGVAWLLWRRPRFRREGMWLAILFVVPAFFNALFMSKKVGFYFLHPVAVLAMMAGSMTATLWQSSSFAKGSRMALLSRGALILVLVNVLAAGIIGRYAALAYQWRQRDYRPVASALAKIVPPDSVIWGPPDIWYAVEQAGASLRIRGEPDPTRHDYLVTKVAGNTVLPPNVRMVGEFGDGLPPVFGALQLRSADYRMRVWEWEQR